MNYGKKKKMAMGGKAMKDVPMDKKKSLGKLPTEVRNKMGFKKAGGKVKKYFEGGKLDAALRKEQIALEGKVKRLGENKKRGTLPKRPKMGDKPKAKKMMGGGMAMKYKHGGKVGKKCPRDGIAMKGKTRA